MKTVVIGGSGLIGTKLVSILRERGNEVVAASPSSGVDAVSGKGLAEALEGARVVVDVANSPSFADDAVLEFFTGSTRNLLAGELAAGVGHHLALSVVGADRLPDSGYLRAKVAQEQAIAAAKVPFTILRATQFFEFLGAIADASTEGDTVRLPPGKVQPIAAEDVSAALAELALGAPVNGVIELGGPEKFGLDEVVGRVLRAGNDSRKVNSDTKATYFGTEIADDSLTTADDARISALRFADWFARA